MLTSSSCNLDWQALSRHGLRRNKIFQSILFPIDFSDSCRATAAHVRDLAGGTVTLLHVMPWWQALYGAADVYSAIDGTETLRGPKRVQMSALARFRDEWFNDVQCQIRVESGSVADLTTPNTVAPI